MKKLLLILITIVVSQISFGQGDGKNAPVTGLPCPQGLCVHWEYSISIFNFHKPRTDCTSGFGLCIRGGGVSTSCVPCGNLKNATSYCKIQNQKAICYGEMKNDKLEFHIPIGIKNEAAYAKEDMKIFDVEKGSLSISINGREKLSKEGSYPVMLAGSEYIVLIDLE